MVEAAVAERFDGAVEDGAAAGVVGRGGGAEGDEGEEPLCSRLRHCCWGGNGSVQCAQ